MASHTLKHRNKIRETTGDRTFKIVNVVLVTIIILVLLYPFYYCVILAFNDGIDAMRPGIYFWPRKPTLDNFIQTIKDPGLPRAAFVSVARTVIGTITAVLTTAAFAYGLSKKKLRFRQFYNTFMIIPMFFGGGIIPTYLLMKSLHLTNNFLVYILPSLFSVFNALIFRAYFEDLPVSLEESAELDGANHLTIFFRLILPCSMPVIAAISVFTAVGHWNSWMDTLYFIRKKPELETLAYKFAHLSQIMTAEMERWKNNPGGVTAGFTPISVQLAAMIISVLPIMVVYPFFQKYFVRGVMIGAMKG